MKKLLVLAILPALITGCFSSDNGGANEYGALGFGEETLSGGYSESSLNDTYLMAAAPKYFVGNPYKVEDITYTPAEDFYYNQTGVAGIIPTELNGAKTSNGETFDASQMVGTSKTLPLPTIVRVTNLDNGQSVVVRVNNRGPFVNSRIMDISPAAAAKIGMRGQTKVQIQVLEEQSLTVKNATLGTTLSEPTPVATAPVATTHVGGYTVQVGAFYSEDSAQQMVSRLRSYGNAVIDNEDGMYKVRFAGLDAASARSTIDNLRSAEGLAPGLLQNGRWVNADSI